MLLELRIALQINRKYCHNCGLYLVLLKRLLKFFFKNAFSTSLITTSPSGPVSYKKCKNIYWPSKKVWPIFFCTFLFKILLQLMHISFDITKSIHYRNMRVSIHLSKIAFLCDVRYLPTHT